VTPWDGSDAAGNTYVYVIRSNLHNMNVFVQILRGNSKNTKFWSLVLNVTFQVFTVALLKMKVLYDVGLLDTKDDGKTNFRNVGNYPPIDIV
jgi:hypothetical protein